MGYAAITGPGGSVEPHFHPVATNHSPCVEYEEPLELPESNNLLQCKREGWLWRCWDLSFMGDFEEELADRYLGME